MGARRLLYLILMKFWGRTLPVILLIFIGVNPATVRGSNTGVFVGVSSSESEDFWNRNHELVNGYGLTGCCRAMFPNRISFTFDFKGEFSDTPVSLLNRLRSISIF